MLKRGFMFKHLPYIFSRRLIRTLTTTISQILNTKQLGDVITIKGWIKSVRNQKDTLFLDVSDGSTCEKLQVFLLKTGKLDGISPGASIAAKGALSVGPKGRIELNAHSVEVLGPCVAMQGYPFAPRKIYPPEYIRQHLHFRPRTNKFGALLRLRSKASLAINNFFALENFIKVDTPILTSNDCEGAGEVFKVVPESEQVQKLMIKNGQSMDEAYFNRKAFLTVSGQLHLEAAAHGLSKVYTFGPTFRAENSRSRLHLSEFYMVEAEIAFVDKIEEVMQVVEHLIKSVTRKMMEESIEDIETCQEKKPEITWLDEKFPVLTYDEVVKVLVENQGKFESGFNEGLAKEHELFIVDYCGNSPVFVVDWPQEMKPFYMKAIGGKVAAFDLLGPNVGEIVGGSLREDSYDKLKARIPANNVNLDWYLELRKFGSVPTGGFGLGFERYLQSILGVLNIKDTIPFPRWPHNCNM